VTIILEVHESPFLEVHETDKMLLMFSLAINQSINSFLLTNKKLYSGNKISR